MRSPGSLFRSTMRDLAEDISSFENKVLRVNAASINAGETVSFSVYPHSDKRRPSAEIDYKKSKEGKVSRVVTIKWDDIDYSGLTDKEEISE